MRTTIRDIARNLNISHSTVSKALNGRMDAFISDATRRRVTEEASRIGYRPNHVARALATGKSNLIGLCVGDFLTYNANVIHHVESHLRRRGYHMVVQGLQNLERGEKLLDWPLDGVLMLDFPEHIRLLLETTHNQVPVVSIGTYSTELVDHVALDLFTGAHLAVQRLIEQGYTRIIYVTSEWGNRVGEPRFDAYRELLNQAGMEQETILVGGPTREESYCAFSPDFISDLLISGSNAEKRKTVLFCFNDEIAIGAYRALLEIGLQIPRDIALVGCDDSRDVQYLECPISSISYSLSQLCALGVDFLDMRLKDPSLGRQQSVVTSCYIERKSTKAE